MFRQDAFFIAVIFLAFITFFTDCKVDAQRTVSERNSIINLLNSDSVIKKDSTIRKITADEKFRMTKSPWKAVLFSAVLPGAGQFYNKSYWKIPVILGIGGYFAYEVVRNNTYYLDYRDRYINSQTQLNPNGDDRLKSYREFYRDQRDQFILYFGAVYLINLILSLIHI